MCRRPLYKMLRERTPRKRSARRHTMKVTIEKNLSSITGYYVSINNWCVRYTFTLWGAKRVVRRIRINEKIQKEVKK